jgi:DNA polymerase-3 subunit beta
MMPSSVPSTAAASAMEITVQKSDLLKELSVTQGVVERKSTVPILASFLFEANENSLLITATDLSVSLRTFCPAKVIKAGSCAVPARKLYEYVRLLRDGEISIRVLENHWVQIRSGRSNTKMASMGRESFPALPLFPAHSAIQMPARVLETMITRTIFAVSQEESRYTLNGALLLIRPGSITMVSTDGHRLARIESVKSQIAVKDETRVLVPRKAMAEINALLSSTDVETVGFARDDSTLFFAIGARLFTARQFTGTFPNYEAVLPHDLNRSVTLPAEPLLRAIQRVSQFSDERSGAVRFKLGEKQLCVSSSSAETGESEDWLETSYSGDPLVMGFQARYVLDFMKVAGKGDVSFHFKTASAAGEFRCDPTSDGTSDYNYRYIVMPMRV